MQNTPPAPLSEPAAADVRDVAAGEVRLGYVQSGAGPHPVVLLHGWPQTSYAWRRVLPLLDADCASVAFDLRGVGHSSIAVRGFDKVTMAGDISAALTGLGIERPVVVGHGIGALVGYAFARRYPTRLSGLVIVDAPLPGIAGWQETVASQASWHIGFHCDVDQGAATADALVDGHQAMYFRSFINRFAAYPHAISDADISVYARGYQGAQRLAAGFAMFRAIAEDVLVNEADNGNFTVPILAAFCEYSYATLLDTVAGGLRETGATEVRTAVLADSGHWPAEEQPAALAELIRGFARSVRAP
jgi:pimeloyl-ACP methyl ester carboxylesterase